MTSATCTAKEASALPAFGGFVDAIHLGLASDQDLEVLLDRYCPEDGDVSNEN